MFYIKYYIKDLITYFKQFKVSIKIFTIVTGRHTRRTSNYNKNIHSHSI